MVGYPHPHHQPHAIPPSTQPSASAKKVSMTPVAHRPSSEPAQPVTTTPKSQSPLHHTSLPFTSPLLPTPNLQPSMGRVSFSASLPTTTPIKASKDLEQEIFTFDSDIIV